MGTVKLHQTCKYAQTLLMSGGGKEKNIPCDWKSIPEMTLKEMSFWQDNPRLADCLADRLKVIDGIKQPRAEKWAPLSSLASWCLKRIRNGSATQSFQVKSVLKWLYWSYAACVWKSATRARAWDSLLLMQKSAVCVWLSVWLSAYILH